MTSGRESYFIPMIAVHNTVYPFDVWIELCVVVRFNASTD